MKENPESKKLTSRAIRLPLVCEMTGASRATIWRWVKGGAGFPKPFQLSPGVTVWDEMDIAYWIESKKAGNGGEQ